jgi:hypothetical protein
MKEIRMNNRDISKIQEKRIVKTLKQVQERARCTPGSGSYWANKGDVVSEDFRIEAKTKAKPSDQITIKKEWLNKIEMEALETRKTPALAISFGDGVDYFILRAEDFIKIIEELKNKP